MKLFFISPFVPPSIDGVGEYTVHLAQTLREKGIDAQILCGENQIPEFPWIHPVFSLGNTSAALKQLKDADWVSLQYVPQLYGKYGISNHLGKFLREIQNKTKSKIMIIFHEHGTDWKKGFKDKILTLLLRRQTQELLKMSAAAVTTCKRYQDSLQLMAPQMPIKTIPVGAGVLPAAADSKTLGTLRRQYGLDGRKVFGIFGRISSFRPFDIFIPILKQLRREKIPAKLLILGAADASAPKLLEKFLQDLKRENLQETAIIPGGMGNHDLSLHLQLLDLYVFPQADGISTRNTTFLSALAHGLPVVAYQPVDGNFSGFSLPPLIQLAARGNCEEFVFKAVEALKLSPQNDDYHKEIRAYFQNFFSWEILTDHFLQILK